MPEFLSVKYMSSVFRLIFNLNSIFNLWFLWTNNVGAYQCNYSGMTFTPDFSHLNLIFDIKNIYIMLFIYFIQFSIKILKEGMYLQVTLIKLYVCSKDVCVLFISSFKS